MKTKFYPLIVLFILIFTSCTKENPRSLTMDFGICEFKEPFVGILSSRPKILVKSLESSIFNGIRPDTIGLRKTFQIEFNEEAVRSHSTATISFVDSLYQPIDGVSFYCNSQPFENNKFIVVADTAFKSLEIICKFDPNKISPQLIEGRLIVQSHNLDQLNGQSFQHASQTVGSWHCEFRYTWPIALWLLWLLMAVIVIALVLLVLYGVIRLLIHMVSRPKIPTVYSRPSRPIVHQPTTKPISEPKQRPLPDEEDDFNDDDDEKEEKDEKEEEKEEEKEKDIPNQMLDYTLNDLQNELYSVNTIHKKALALKKILKCLKELDDIDEKLDDEQFKLLDKSTRKLLDRVWRVLRLPKANSYRGKWNGKEGYSKWIPNENYIPRKENPNEYTWGDIMQNGIVIHELHAPSRFINFDGIRFKFQIPSFERYSLYTVKIEYDRMNLSRYDKNGRRGFHELAFAQLVNDGKFNSVLEAKEFKESNHLLWHEDIDCKTMYLVPTIIHNNIPHGGGTGVSKAINKYGFRRFGQHNYPLGSRSQIIENFNLRHGRNSF